MIGRRIGAGRCERSQEIALTRPMALDRLEYRGGVEGTRVIFSELVMDVKLVVLGGKHPGQEIAVQGPEFLVGRAPECKLRPNSDMVSRRHCMISIAEGRATIRDLGSRNGTIVNDREDQPASTNFAPATRSRSGRWSSRCI